MVTKRLIAPVLAGLLLVGCTAPAPVPVPTPTPSPVCTPEAGGAEYPCTQAEFEKMKARDALYAEAEEVNREFQSILERIYREGAPDELPVDLTEITAGSARTDGEEWLSGLREDDFTMVGGEMRQVWVKRNLASIEGSDVSLSVCIDSSTVDVFENGKPVGKGDFSLEHAFFKRIDGDLKVWAVDGEFVESCE